MRDVKRIDVMIELLRIAWHNDPDLRLGQLVSNIIDGRYPTINKDHYRSALRLLEDDRMQDAIVEYTRKG